MGELAVLSSMGSERLPLRVNVPFGGQSHRCGDPRSHADVGEYSGVTSSWGLLMREMNARLHLHRLEDGT